MEAVIVIDVLRRAGVEVTVASVEASLQIKASRGVNLVADVLIAECVNQTYDLVVIPGGMPGAERLRDSEHLQKLLQTQKQKVSCETTFMAMVRVLHRDLASC